MKIVKLKGGLGNQMFQYGFAKLIQVITEDEVKIDLSSFATLKNDQIRKPRIKEFCITLDEADKIDLDDKLMFDHSCPPLELRYKMGILFESIINRKYYLENDRAYRDPMTLISRDFFDGYWQSYRYIDRVKEILLKEFVPNYELNVRTKQMMEETKSENSVFIGVRRGDYLKESKHYGSFDSNYYEAAMGILERRISNPIYYIFSNDIDWCKNNINWGSRNVIFREREDQVSDFEELMIMRSCSNAIIINSTFHWWGAYMISNPNKTVIAPQNWFSDNKPIDIVPPEWKRL